MGLSANIIKSPEAFLVFKLLGAACLFYVGIKTLISAYKPSIKNASQLKENPLLSEKSAGHSKLGGFVEGFLTNALIPKVSLLYLAAFPQFIGQSDSVFYWGLVLVTVLAFMNAYWFCIIVCIVNKTKNYAAVPAL